MLKLRVLKEDFKIRTVNYRSLNGKLIPKLR